MQTGKMATTEDNMSSGSKNARKRMAAACWISKSIV
jgi:hypothetical protein